VQVGSPTVGAPAERATVPQTFTDAEPGVHEPNSELCAWGRNVGGGGGAGYWIIGPMGPGSVDGKHLRLRTMSNAATGGDPRDQLVEIVTLLYRCPETKEHRTYIGKHPHDHCRRRIPFSLIFESDSI
jgi:hypothetical protein